jgi:hypothetical protein
MKSLVKNIREFFNKRTRATDAMKEAHVNRQTLVLQNGEAASRLLRNEDFALMFNLYRCWSGWKMQPMTPKELATHIMLLGCAISLASWRRVNISLRNWEKPNLTKWCNICQT